MPSQLLLTFAILLLAIALLLTDRLRADLVALLVVVALGVTGVLTPREAFSGFASSAVVTIVAIFILAEALRITGMTERAGDLPYLRLNPFLRLPNAERFRRLQPENLGSPERKHHG